MKMRPGGPLTFSERVCGVVSDADLRLLQLNSPREQFEPVADDFLALTVDIQRYTLIYVQKTLTAVRLKPAQIERLKRIAIREDVPVSWLIRKAIDEFLKRRK